MDEKKAIAVEGAAGFATSDFLTGVACSSVSLAKRPSLNGKMKSEFATMKNSGLVCGGKGAQLYYQHTHGAASRQ